MHHCQPLFRKEIANGSFLLAGIAAEACGDKILKTSLNSGAQQSALLACDGPRH
jgi:hypothetical protein